MGFEMVAYLALQSFVANDEQYRKYVEAVNPLLSRFGAKLIVRPCRDRAPQLRP